jgi:hypothetical protein
MEGTTVEGRSVGRQKRPPYLDIYTQECQTYSQKTFTRQAAGLVAICWLVAIAPLGTQYW